MSVLLFFCFTFPATGQETKQLETVVIGDSRFILHTVQRKETLYSISRQYDCTQEEVLSNNKNIEGVIKKGMILKIPDHTWQKPRTVKIDENKIIRHIVISGDNYYQLKIRYGAEEDELLKLNPDLKDGLKAGMVILVPKKSPEEISAVDNPGNEAASKNILPPLKMKGNDKTLNIGLYLPISASVTDSLKPSARTLSFLAFYQGALLAADQKIKSGLNTKLYVYDTEKMASSIEVLIKKPEFLSFDLLIGPVYPENQKVISELSAKNRIPMVSPLSPEDKYTRTNPYYFQINPARKFRFEATAEYIFKEFRKEKILFLETGNGSNETKLIREQLLKKSVSPVGSKTRVESYNIWSQGVEGLESQLQVDKPNIFVMAELNEVNVSIAMNRLALVSKKFPIIIIGIQEFTRMQSIELENLHNINLRYLSSSFIDYSNPAVITFVENFRTEFGTEPSLFAFQGYDIITYFLNSLQKSGNLSRGIPSDAGKGMLMEAFHFAKTTDFGGYTNDSFTVVEYSNTFDVRSLGVFPTN